MASLPAFNQLIVSTSSGQLFSYSLDIIARMSQGELRVKNMNDNVETLCGSDVGFFGVGNLAGRTLGKNTRSMVEANQCSCHAFQWFMGRKDLLDRLPYRP
jgi:hypothetical protein